MGIFLLIYFYIFAGLLFAQSTATVLQDIPLWKRLFFWPAEIIEFACRWYTGFGFVAICRLAPYIKK